MTAKNSKSTSKTRKQLSEYISLRKDCRACGGPLETVLDLGVQQIVNLGGKEKRSAPLELTKCQSCSLVQLRHTVDRDYLFRNYYYRSGATQTMRDHLKGVVEDVMKRVEFVPWNDAKNDVVVDIGSNDGALLNQYPPNTVYSVGYEPCRELWDYSRSHGIKSVEGSVHNAFFSAEDYESRGYHKAKVITAIAMFYDLDDPNAFLQDVKKVLAPEGLFVLQVNYLPDTLRNNAIGDICHEHLCYYDFGSLVGLLRKNGFGVMEFSKNDINGGSIRLFCKHWEWRKEILSFPDPYVEDFGGFADRISTIARKTREYVETLRKLGKTITVIGASTRGATFLQYAGLAPKYGVLLDCVERDASKVGKWYLGLHIISEEQDKAQPSDWYLLAMPWLEKEVRERMPWVRRLILPLPEPRIVVDGQTSPL